MYVKVIACDDPSLWYADQIGVIFHARKYIQGDGYEVLTNNETMRTINYIRVQDSMKYYPCQILEILNNDD